MTVNDVADVLKLDPQTVRNWIDAGALPALRIGRRVRIKRSDIDRFVDQGYAGRELRVELHAEEGELQRIERARCARPRRATSCAREHRPACAPGGISTGGCAAPGRRRSERGTPSGGCTIGIAVNGQWLMPPYSDPARDRSNFTQCHGSELPALLDTTRYPNGGVSLRFGATNAAGVTSAPTKAMLVDNAPVTLRLSGRTDASSTAGTQYVSAVGDGGRERRVDRVLSRRQPLTNGISVQAPRSR